MKKTGWMTSSPNQKLNVFNCVAMTHSFQTQSKKDVGEAKHPLLPREALR